MLEDRYYMRQPAFDARRSATIGLLIANVAVFFFECLRYGYPPGERLPYGDPLPLSWQGLQHGYIWQLVTFQFMHAGLLHLVGNCWVIYVFGREIEQALGVRRFLTLYFSSGIVGGLFQALAGAWASHYPMSDWARAFVGPTVGASAGALGLLAGFAMLYPERPLMLLLFFIIPIKMRAKFLLVFSGLLALFGILFPYAHLADAAHLGGILTGVFFVRHVIHWQWHWPQFRRGGKQVPRRLVRVSSGNSTNWRRNRSGADEELPPDEFLSKEVDPILDKISAQGIGSLTERERRILETARERMGRR